MSIDYIKKQAKRLSRLLPAHLAAYPDPSMLSACQELAAQSNGYPSFHAAKSKNALNHPTTTDVIRARLDLLRGPSKQIEKVIYADARKQPEMVFRKLTRQAFDRVIFIGSVDLEWRQHLLECGFAVDVAENAPAGIDVLTASGDACAIETWLKLNG